MIAEQNKKATIIIYALITVIGILFVTSLLAINLFTYQEKKLADRFYPNVLIDKQDVGYKTKAEINTIYDKKDKELAATTLEIQYKGEKIATFSAQQLHIRTNGHEIVDRAYQVGRSSNPSSQLYQKLVTIMRLNHFDFVTHVTYDKDALLEFTSNTEEQYNRPAKNALFNFENGKVTVFREDEKGLQMNTEKLMREVDQKISALTDKKNILITYEDITIDPETTLSESNNFGVEELIGEGISNYTHSSPERVHNLTLAASKFHGVLIPKDKIISFNEIVGDISSLTGYLPGYIIQNGRTVLGDGGGVCQVSTTLFRAALNTGLPIIERTAHAYRVIYYENDAKPGLDATVFSPSVDLKVKNDTPGSILIQVEQDKDNNILKLKFYGKKDNRKVEISPIQVYDVQPPPPARNQDDPTLKKGVVKQVDYPAWGAKSVFTYKVSNAEKTIFEKTFYSVYKPWAAVYLVGTAD